MTQDRFPMTIGGEEVLNEHHLLAYTENGEMMDSPLSVRFLVIHCSATRADRNYTDKQLMRDHKKRGFRTVGYLSMSTRTEASRSSESCWRWAHMPAHTTAAPSASATRVGWMTRGVLPTPLPAPSMTQCGICCASSKSRSHRLR